MSQPRPPLKENRRPPLKRKSSAPSSSSTPDAADSNSRPPLRRGSSFTFLTPGPWDFTLKRKRRAKDDDVVSLCSLDIKEPSNKRVRPLSRVTSLANLISPSKNGAVRRFGQTLQRSITFRSDNKSPSCSQKLCSKTSAPTPPKRRNSKLWSETLDMSTKQHFSSKEIKRQEAIFELFRGEQDLIEDLKLARKAYHDPMLKLSIMTEEELTQIFGALDSYIPLHEDLLSKLAKATKQDGTVEQIGQILVSWLPRLDEYKEYCSNQLAAKALLDQKKQDKRVQDFLQRCLESPFSRKLDLWSFLDIPRSRLVKYPLLLKEILRHTPTDHLDQKSLENAIAIIQGVLSDINLKKGESDCQYYVDKLDYLDERQKDARIESSKVLLCHGELRNNRGTKLYVFLFQEILVLTRPVSRNDRQCYQVYRQPIPVKDLLLEDLQDGDTKMGGSFRGAFGNSDKAKNIFRVRFRHTVQGQSSHTLQANDIYNKQQWMNCLRNAMYLYQPSPCPTDHKELFELNEEAEQSSPQSAELAQEGQSPILSEGVEMADGQSETGSSMDTSESETSSLRTSIESEETVEQCDFLSKQSIETVEQQEQITKRTETLV
ncbi:neuroepithelial cell-transforming gene 1 protein isoform X2 [Scyliorhinus canicula]|uniref:neuroepithelial cell-transforming gene 1 protein isoform X2 n=1 Tax=Scyliorhinus canicula TaxID=7830 RepID=UPI0018F777DC|nr:neuroepithelial cell-transforming gene 1 protein isoform X2 [Scyliorhinus canicula]